MPVDASLVLEIKFVCQTQICDPGAEHNDHVCRIHPIKSSEDSLGNTLMNSGALPLSSTAVSGEGYEGYWCWLWPHRHEVP